MNQQHSEAGHVFLVGTVIKVFRNDDLSFLCGKKSVTSNSEWFLKRGTRLDREVIFIIRGTGESDVIILDFEEPLVFGAGGTRQEVVAKHFPHLFHHHPKTDIPDEACPPGCSHQVHLRMPCAIGEHLQDGGLGAIPNVLDAV